MVPVRRYSQEFAQESAGDGEHRQSEAWPVGVHAGVGGGGFSSPWDCVRLFPCPPRPAHKAADEDVGE